MTTINLPHRFYEREFPEIGEIAIVTATAVTELGAYVSLNEYRDLNGMIQLAELSQRRVRSYSKVIRVGHTDAATVVRVDPEKGIVDLSRRRLPPSEIAEAMERFGKARAVGGIVRNVALHVIANGKDISTLGSDELARADALQHQIYVDIVWPYCLTHGEAYNAFLEIALADSVTTTTTVDNLPPSSLDPAILRALVDDICLRIKPELVTVKTDVKMQCAGQDGLFILRKALAAAVATSPEIRVTLLAPPSYRFSIETLNASLGAIQVETAIKAAESIITSISGGVLIIDE